MCGDRVGGHDVCDGSAGEHDVLGRARLGTRCASSLFQVQLNLQLIHLLDFLPVRDPRGIA
eukprot:1320269-Pleurochrysis_carterae.AAC.1